MLLKNYEMHLPSYSIGDAIYDQIEELCSPFGKKVFIIGGKKALAASIDKIKASLDKTSLTVIDTLTYTHDCTYNCVDAIREMVSYKDCDMVFAIGGGKVIDTCKCLCIDDEKPIFTFPTIASNCAACTSVSIMYNDDGTFLKPHFFKHPPQHTFIDTEIIAKAPAKYMWAGIGDTYAKYYESTISSRDEELQHFTALGTVISKMCLEPLLIYGPKGYEDNKNGVVSYEFEQTALAIIISTGLASIFLTRDFTPDYNSGLAHAIFYALTRFPVTEERHIHGEVVSFGVLIALIVDGQLDEFKKVFELNKKIGLPTKLSDIEITDEEFASILPEIGGMSDVRHYPYAVTVEMLENALKILNEAN